MVRRFFFWIHLFVGVTAGVVILIMSVTGVALAFQKQIVAWVERDLRVTPTTDAIVPSRIVAAAKAARPEGKPASITLRSDPAAPATVSFGRDGSLYVDPYRAVVLGEGAKATRAVFRKIEDWHRWLALEGDLRARGKAVTGVCNAGFFFLVLSGLYIWFPNTIGRFRRGARGRARDFNWHNVIGVWSFVPLAAIVFSGIAISYPPARPQQQQQQGNEPRPRGRGASADVDQLWITARAEATRIAPDWKSISVRFPIEKRATFSVDRGRGTRPDLRSSLIFDAKSGRLIEHETYTSQNAERKTRSWLRWIHTGEAGGIPGQVVAAIASAGAVVLVWTGIALSLRRLRAWLRRTAAAAPTTTEESRV